MSKVDRRIHKSQEAIKNAVIELMSEKKFDEVTIQEIADRANINRRTIYLHYMDKFDLLDKLIEEHINELRKMCELTSDTAFLEGSVSWFEYFESHYSFFSAMLTSKGAPFFRSRFLEFVIEDIKKGWDMTNAKNHGLNEDIILQFFAPAYVGVVEWWFRNSMPYPSHVMEEHVGMLFEKSLL
jgi:AcrR family transcriptional regulator